ncbi:hypothetical protein AKJ35_01340 [candidate division MSBL1 archaeon SCGC-AAA833F18]|uniref:PIN domain-containing protein n=1 Tax=candidate division MSBL1 archaeon SCGC-AAA833F18 TaxID=1698257 RepID=A0A133VRS6_9EURY|nr:hypothetical protein AKJ35_01340 [candidate division MSBL1 archaeon SCGC-AAA833F18]
MSRVLFDTYAWIEYLEGSKKGETAEKFLDDQDTEVYTSILAIGELSDAFHRDGVDTEFDWGEIQDFIQMNSVIVDLNVEEMADAGKLKVERRKEVKDFGLIDAMILKSSKKLDAKLLTGDPHLTEEDNAMLL